MHSIPTKDILEERGFMGEVQCNDSRESILHVLRDCPYAKCFWNKTQACMFMHDFYSLDLCLWMKRIWALFPAIILWFLGIFIFLLPFGTFGRIEIIFCLRTLLQTVTWVEMLLCCRWTFVLWFSVCNGQRECSGLMLGRINLRLSSLNLTQMAHLWAIRRWLMEGALSVTIVVFGLKYLPKTLGWPPMLMQSFGLQGMGWHHV